MLDPQIGLIWSAVFSLGIKTYTSSPFPLASLCIGMLGFASTFFMRVSIPLPFPPSCMREILHHLPRMRYGIHVAQPSCFHMRCLPPHCYLFLGRVGDAIQPGAVASTSQTCTSASSAHYLPTMLCTSESEAWTRGILHCRHAVAPPHGPECRCISYHFISCTAVVCSRQDQCCRLATAGSLPTCKCKLRGGCSASLRMYCIITDALLPCGCTASQSEPDSALLVLCCSAAAFGSSEWVWLTNGLPLGTLSGGGH